MNRLNESLCPTSYMYCLSHILLCYLDLWQAGISSWFPQTCHHRIISTHTITSSQDWGVFKSLPSSCVLCKVVGKESSFMAPTYYRDEHMPLTASEVFSSSTQVHVHTTADCFWTNEAHLIYSYLCWANCNTLHTTGNVFHEFKLWFPLGHVLITVMAIWLSQKLSSMCSLLFLVWGNMCIWAVNRSIVLEEAILWAPPTDKSRQRIFRKVVTFDPKLWGNTQLWANLD